ncbi:S8 family serine peptidase [candidate division WOR-3 bacterium]|nr:S8 family serine peptidase [candidate division WOR-3 bacterium]
MSLLALLIFNGVEGPFLLTATVEPYEDAYYLLLASDTIDTRFIDSKAFGEVIHSKRAVVKFAYAPGRDERLLLERAGLVIEGYIPHYAYLVSGNSDAMTLLSNEECICWVSPYEASWRIAPGLLSSNLSTDTLHLWLFDDAEVEKTSQVLADSFNAQVLSSHAGQYKLIRICVKPEHLLRIAALDAVRWIEPWYKPTYLNDSSQWVLQSWVEENRSLWNRGLRGEGVIVSTGDSGLRTSHLMFADSSIVIGNWGDFPAHRKIIAYQPSSPAAVFGDASAFSYHGTHTAGTVCGDDSYWKGSSPYDGLAPSAKLYFIDNGGVDDIAYPESYYEMYSLPWQGNDAGKATIMSNSWRTSTVERIYDLACRETDEFTWDHPDFMILYSAGNSGSLGVTPPSTAKNVVSVGATGNGSTADIPAGFSSEGPTADNRLRPAIVAPGYLVSADGSGTNGYKLSYGTSMSSPSVAGVSALIVQYLREGWYPQGSPSSVSIEPSSALLKALLLSSTVADFSERSIPDSKVGWGRVCVDSVLFFAGEENHLYLHDYDPGIDQDQEICYFVDVKGNSWPLRVTLVWTDPPAEMVAAKTLVNDLDLEVRSPSGGIYKGNVFSIGFSKKYGSADNTNTEECLRIRNPEPGTWKLLVRARNVPLGPQPYAIVITGMMEVNASQLAGKDMRIDDSEQGNDDQALDPGETALLFPRITNHSEHPAEAVEVRLESLDPALEIVTQDNADYGDIMPNQTVEGSGFLVALKTQTEIGKKIILNAIVSDANLDTIQYTLTVGHSGMEENEYTSRPSIFYLSPVRNDARILLLLPSTQSITLEAFDATGRRIQILAENSLLETGLHTFCLAEHQPSGVYFFRLSTPSCTERVKIVKVKD